MEAMAPGALPRRQTKPATRGTNTPVVITSEAIQEICRMERTPRAMSRAQTVTSRVAARENRSFLFSSCSLVFRSRARVMAPVLISESMVDMTAAEMPTKAMAPSTGGRQFTTTAVTTPPWGRVGKSTSPAMPVSTTTK